MKIITGTIKLGKKSRYPVLTLGNYDGVHRAHRKIIRKVTSIAEKKAGTSILLTFDPHPVRLLCPELTPPLLQTIDQKVRALTELGLDIVIIEPFTKALAKLNADAFFDKIIVGRIGAREIVTGYDFTFGQHRAGGVGDLARLAGRRGITVHIVDAILHKESLISSTQIRHYIEKGEVAAAGTMLGRAYSIGGTVIKGRGIGAELGFHTANLKTGNELIPPPGVYITATTLTKGALTKGGRRYRSVTNIGYNPTFGGTDLSVETYLLDFRGELLRQRIDIEFYKKIRREMTFESPEDLRCQIIKDVEATRRFYEKGI